MKAKHKYRVNVYLGKELHNQLEEVSNYMQVPISAIAKLILKTGFEFSNLMERYIDNIEVDNGKLQ